jgi:uncharacterized protein (DUF2249 family)/iron-sulfur cluster repair protein YtfE (RIC family)
VDTMFVASNAEDAAAAEAVKQHHAEMSGALAALAARIAAAPDRESALASRDELVRWAERELVPHARAEEAAMYPPAHEDPRARLLVDAMLAEHQLIVGLVESLREAQDHVRAAAEARALSVTFESHLAKENDQILPLLAQSAEVSLAGALEGMHSLLGGGGEGHEHDRGEHHHEHNHEHHHHGPESGHGHAHHGDEANADPAASGNGGTCTCGEAEGADLPELDARSVPHAIRHATIFGALDSVKPGGGLVLVAPHDPLPLLRQLEGRSPGSFAVDYLQRGPEAWRIRFVRA